MVSVMLVDDEPDVVLLFGMFLEARGYQVLCKASNGRKALESYASLDPKPDVIIMDYRMPEMDGLETTKALIDLDPQAKIFFASADYTVREKALRAGAVGFFDKPFDLDTMIHKINELVTA